VSSTSLKVIDRFFDEYRWLSNFYRSPIFYNNTSYVTAEHAYQAAKATNHHDHDLVQCAHTAGQAKSIAQTIKCRPGWEVVKYGIMREVVQAKFKIPAMADKLLATGEAELIEGNTWGDTTWGVCDGVGANWLGKILMDVREELKQQKIKAVWIQRVFSSVVRAMAHFGAMFSLLSW
jgi:ribA/ribD-fused uncharacterized protein